MEAPSLPPSVMRAVFIFGQQASAVGVEKEAAPEAGRDKTDIAMMNDDDDDDSKQWRRPLGERDDEEEMTRHAAASHPGNALLIRPQQSLDSYVKLEDLSVPSQRA